MDMSLGESLAELDSMLDDAARPFRDLTWKQIFPLPTAAALAGAQIKNYLCPTFLLDQVHDGVLSQYTTLYLLSKLFYSATFM